MQDEFVPPERVGFIGLGNMGAPMARNLAAAGFRVVAADANPEALARVRSTVDCESAGSLAEIGRSCRLVITMLPDGHAVQQVLFGADGVAPNLAAGSVVLDMTSAAPVGTRALGLKLAESGVCLIDAPVSGGVKRAVDGTLAIMVGGDATGVARCRLIFQAFGKVFVTGPSGSGHAMKALNNYLSAAALAATAEAMMAGARFGIDPKVMLDILNHSTGRNTATELKYPSFVLPRTFNSGFALGLMAKDLRIALDLTRSVGTPAALLRECSDVWNRAEQRLGSGVDHTEIVRYLELLQESGSHG